MRLLQNEHWVKYNWVKDSAMSVCFCIYTVKHKTTNVLLNYTSWTCEIVGKNNEGLIELFSEKQIKSLTLSWRRPLLYRNQWTGFYVIGAFVIKELIVMVSQWLTYLSIKHEIGNTWMSFLYFLTTTTIKFKFAVY